MKKVLVGLPADARPAVGQQVQDMVAVGGWTLRMPAVHRLGNPHKLAQRDQLAAWLEREADGCAGVLVSIDTLVYGGVHGASRIADEINSLLPRLLLLQRLKWRARRRPVYAFSTVLQISEGESPEETGSHWEGWRRRLCAWSFHSDKAAQTHDASAATLADRAQLQIPAAVREHYRALRARNRAVNLALLDLLEAGVIDRLCFSVENDVDFGFEMAEMRELTDRAASRGLAARVCVQTGVGAGMHTLAAHMVAALRNAAPLRIALLRNPPRRREDVPCQDEDDPVRSVVASQAEAVGACLVEAHDQADVFLAVGDAALLSPLGDQRAVSRPVAYAAGVGKGSGLGELMARLSLARRKPGPRARDP